MIKSKSLDIGDILLILKRHRLLMAGVIAVFVIGFLGASLVLPKRFKSFAVLSIYTEYFQNPLVKEFLPAIYDANELRAQREALVRNAFSDQFVEELGEKHSLFHSERGETKRVIEVQELQRAIEVYNLGLTTVQIGYTGRSREKTYEIMKDVVARATQTLAVERRRTTERLRDSIRKRIEAISMTMQSTADPLASARPEILKRELERLIAQIDALRKQYTESHPSVSKLQARANLIRSWLKKSDNPNAESGATGIAPPLVGGEPREATMQVYEDLLKKLNYLNIVIEMEGSGDNNYVTLASSPQVPLSPVFPKKGVFLLWGLLTGLMVSMFIVLVREYFERTVPSIEEFADKLGTPYLGRVPSLVWGGNTPQPSDDSDKRSKKKVSERVDGWN